MHENNMNILTVIQRYHPVIGGSEILTKNFMDYLAKKHKITVYTSTAKSISSFWNKNSQRVTNPPQLAYEVKRYDFLTPSEILHNTEIEKLPLITSFPGPFSPNMWNDLVIKKLNFDLLFATSFPYDHIFPAYVGAKKHNIPIIIMPLIHQQFPELYLSSVKLTILDNSDAIFTVSESEKKFLKDNGIDEKKISVIKPILKINPKINLNDFKEKFPNFKGKIILFVGLKSEMKGIIHLIETMKMVWKKKNDVILVLIGPSTSDFKNYFLQLDEKYRKKIIDFGIVNEDEKNSAIAACDIFVLPSKGESFGLAYLEAWLHSKPVIGCNLAPIYELIESGKNGILTEFGNLKQLEKSIIELLENPDICNKLGSEGKKKAMIFTSNNIFKEFEEKCISVIDSFQHK